MGEKGPHTLGEKKAGTKNYPDELFGGFPGPLSRPNPGIFCAGQEARILASGLLPRSIMSLGMGPVGRNCQFPLLRRLQKRGFPIGMCEITQTTARGGHCMHLHRMSWNSTRNSNKRAIDTPIELVLSTFKKHCGRKMNTPPPTHPKSLDLWLEKKERKRKKKEKKLRIRSVYLYLTLPRGSKSPSTPPLQQLGL